MYFNLIGIVFFVAIYYLIIKYNHDELPIKKKNHDEL